MVVVSTPITTYYFAKEVEADIVPIDRTILRESRYGVLELISKETYKFNMADDYSEKERSRRRLYLLRGIRRDLERIIKMSYKDIDRRR